LLALKLKTRDGDEEKDVRLTKELGQCNAATLVALSWRTAEDAIAGILTTTIALRLLWAQNVS
jgi:hypothetical protein